MKTADLSSAPISLGEKSASRSRLSDLSQLVKSRLTVLVLMTTGVGFYLGTRGPLNVAGLLHVLFGTALAAAGASALNQWWERDLDAVMSRTRARPVPAGRMASRHALVLGSALSAGGVIYLALANNFWAALLAAITILVYVCGYTPLKRLTTTNTLIGAIPGALPPLIGWVAARGVLNLGAWSLFAIVFVWQMPHFFAIAWLYRRDYERAGFRMLSSDDESGARSASQAVLFCMVLLLIAGTPAFIGMAHPFFLAAELILGGAFTAIALSFHQHGDALHARRLFFASIAYLPLVLIALMIAKR